MSLSSFKQFSNAFVNKQLTRRLILVVKRPQNTIYAAVDVLRSEMRKRLELMLILCFNRVIKMTGLLNHPMNMNFNEENYSR